MFDHLPRFKDAPVLSARLGLKLFPVRLIPLPNGHVDKPPALPDEGGFHLATDNPAQLSQWATEYPDAFCGVPCRMNGFVVLDDDSHVKGKGSLAALEAELGPLGAQLIHTSVRGGRQRWMQDPGVPLRGKLSKDDDFDIKANGYVVLSNIPDDWRARLAPLPPAWLERLQAPTGSASTPPPTPRPSLGTPVLDGLVAALAPHWVEGNRNYLALYIAGWLLKEGVPVEDVRAVIGALAAHDPQRVSRLNAVERTARKLAAGETVVGWQGLTSLLDDETTATLAELIPAQEITITDDIGADPWERALTLQDLEALPPLRRLVEDGPGLALGSHTLLVSPANEGKSLTALDLGLCVALGRPWHDHQVRQAPVFYMAAEFPADLEARVKALLIRYGIALVPSPSLDIRFFVIPVNLRNRAALKKLVQLHIEPFFHGRPGLIIADTLAALFGGGDENSPEDMGEFVQNIRYLIRETHASAVLTLHHPPKSSPTVVRGHSALRGDVDAVVLLENTDSFISLAMDKIRYAAFPELPRLRIVPCSVVVARGDEVSTAYVKASTHAERETELDARFWQGDLPEKARRMYDVLRDMEPVSQTEWFAACKEQSIGVRTCFRHKKRLYAFNFVDYDSKSKKWSTSVDVIPRHAQDLVINTGSTS